MATIATHNGGSKANRDHNIRNPKVVAKEKHIDPNGHYEIWRDERPRTAYKRLFGEALEEFNARERHADRRIKDYYVAMSHDKQKHAVYEMIISVGNRQDPIPEAIGKRIMREFVGGWSQRNPNLELIGAYYHADEGGVPHVHLDYIPVARDCKRGMRVQNSLSKALNAQGFWTSSRKLTAQICWESAENRTLEDICKRYGIAVEHPDIEGRTHLETEVYKLRQEVERLEGIIKEQDYENEGLISECLTLREKYDEIVEESEEAEQELMSFRETVKALKQEAKTYERMIVNFNEVLENMKAEAKSVEAQIERDYKRGIAKGFSRAEIESHVKKDMTEKRTQKFIDELGIRGMYEAYLKNPNSLSAQLQKQQKKERGDYGD